MGTEVPTFLRFALVTQRRVGRQLIYAMVPAVMNGLVAYLPENCGGQEAGCGPACEPAAVSSATSRKTPAA